MAYKSNYKTLLILLFVNSYLQNKFKSVPFPV